MTDISGHPLRLRVAHLDPHRPNSFALRPDADTRAAIAQELDLIGLPRLGFMGQIRATSGEAWELQGTLTARVTQACVVTLKPVKTTLETQARRLYTPHLSTPEGDEVEMPDDELEPLGQFIDVSAVMVEELALALPEYPRAEGADLGNPAKDEEPGADTRRPFAGLDQLLRGKD